MSDWRIWQSGQADVPLPRTPFRDRDRHKYGMDMSEKCID
jgi:hypothetical protein